MELMTKSIDDLLRDEEPAILEEARTRVARLEHYRRDGDSQTAERLQGLYRRLVRALRPKSLSAALTGKPQPPRLAIVCVGCDEFYRPGSNESVPGIAKLIRGRLGEAAERVGSPVLFPDLGQRTPAGPAAQPVLVQRGDDRAGTDDVDPDPVGGVIQGQCPAQQGAVVTAS